MEIPPLGCNPHPEEMFQFVEIIHCEFPAELCLDICNISFVLGGDEQVVDPNRDVNIPFRINVKAGVRARSHKLNPNEESADLSVTDTCCLLEPIKGSQQSTYELPLHPGPHKPFRLCHINLLF